MSRLQDVIDVPGLKVHLDSHTERTPLLHSIVSEVAALLTRVIVVGVHHRVSTANEKHYQMQRFP